jgi:hypothetical protein
LNAWNELLDEFRALGGTAENIRMDYGELGRGLFPIEAAKPVVIDIPPNLIVGTADMIFENGTPRVGPNAKTGEREKAWLDRYQAEVGWGDGQAGGIRQLFDMVAALPKELRHELSAEYQCGPWFQEPTEDLIRSCYFESRHIHHKGKPVVMPLIELINHGDGTKYTGTDSIRITGTFPGEILVQYSDVDAFEFFRAWGFSLPRAVAFSTTVAGNIPSGTLKIGRGYSGPARSERDWIPKLEKTDGGVTMPFLMIGNQRYPRLPKGIFYRLMRDAGQSDFEEAFDLIQHANRLRFLGLLKALGGIDVPMSRTLRAMAHDQLRAMSFCFGVREI